MTANNSASSDSNSKESSAKVVCITGASKRIGAGIAELFHQQGFNIIIHYNSSSKEALELIEKFNQQRTNSACTVDADLCDSSQLEKLAADILEKFGRLDVLVNNASRYYPTKFGKVDQQQWDDLIDSNLRGAFFLSQSVSEELGRRHGSIINMVDTHADKALGNHSVYCIAKAGLKAMTRSLALDLAPSVRVNAVSPGAILWSESLENSEDSDAQEQRARIISKIPAGRLGEISEIAATVFFLAISANYVTGITIKVDGGRSLGL